VNECNNKYNNEIPLILSRLLSPCLSLSLCPSHFVHSYIYLVKSLPLWLWSSQELCLIALYLLLFSLFFGGVLVALVAQKFNVNWGALSTPIKQNRKLPPRHTPQEIEKKNLYKKLQHENLRRQHFLILLIINIITIKLHWRHTHISSQVDIIISTVSYCHHHFFYNRRGTTPLIRKYHHNIL